MNVLFVCHKHPFRIHGGAEKSVSAIMKYFVSLGHSVTALAIGVEDEEIHGVKVVGVGIDYNIRQNDIIFTWGSVAESTARICFSHKKPYVLMVRWWRNVCDVQNIGDLMNKELPLNLKQVNQPIFDNAHAVITNNHYSHQVIDKHYGRGALISYVPVEGQSSSLSDKDGYIVAISPNKGLGEMRVIIDIAAQLSNRKFLIVNAPKYDISQYNRRSNIECIGHINNMEFIWGKSSILIQPIYENDICGTLRVTIEAQQHGVPVIANDRCGMSEKIRNLVPYSANTNDWVKKIIEVQNDHDNQSELAIEMFDNYDTLKQLEVFKSVL